MLVNWGHVSILLNIYKTIITGYEQRPDINIVKGDSLLLLELTDSFETNIRKNFDRKAKRYQQLIAKLSNKYKVSYINLSLDVIGGIIGNDSLIMTTMENFGLCKETLDFTVNRTLHICIRRTYYIFCMRNKELENPELLNWGKLIQTS